nr:GNAT family N-acetyltransferase [Shimia biformata]
MYEVIESTWPPASTRKIGNVTLREGRGGGKRVSAATVDGALDPQKLPDFEAAMRAMDQPALFMIRDGQEVLDMQLADAGYEVIDPVTMYAAPAQDIASEVPPRTAAIAAWEPLQIMLEIWQAGGIGAGRIEVMKRAEGPKTGFISRWNDHPAGTSFMAVHDGVGMVHALEILPSQRRQGVARWLMRRAAFWTLARGGHTLAVICTTANQGANALYSSLGMTVVGQYHYRIKQD